MAGHLRAWALAGGLAFGCCAGAVGHSQGTSAVYVVIHIDVESAHAGDASEALGVYARQSRGQKGCLEVEVLEEPARLNHFTVLEAWSSAEALAGHEDSAEAKRMRARLQPILGSPFDERLHRRIE